MTRAGRYLVAFGCVVLAVLLAQHEGGYRPDPGPLAALWLALLLAAAAIVPVRRG